MAEEFAVLELEAEPPPQGCADDYLDTFVVQVGQGNFAQKFILHRTIFQPRSKFFAVACSDRWKSSRAEGAPIDLPDDDPVVFDLYRSFVMGESYLTTPNPMTTFVTDEDWERLIQLYGLSDKLEDCRTCNNVITRIISIFFESLALEKGANLLDHYELAFAMTTERSPLRRLLVDILAFRYNSPVGETPRSDVPHEALYGAWQQLTSIIERRPETMVKDAFDYHFIREETHRYHRFDELHPRCGCNRSEEEECRYSFD